jgi:uncharacterized protein (TIGR03437 family)
MLQPCERDPANLSANAARPRHSPPHFWNTERMRIARSVHGWIAVLILSPALLAGHIEIIKEPPSVRGASAASSPLSTYFLRSRNINPTKVAIDTAGNTYVAGDSNGDIFLCKLDGDLRTLYTVFWGGEGAESVTGLAVNSSGEIYVAGQTLSADYPTLQAAQASFGGSSDGFLTKLSANGGFLYSTYLGGTKEDAIAALALDATGNAYVTGSTASQDFPVSSGGFQRTMVSADSFHRPVSAFVAKIAVDGKLAYSTFLSGTRVVCRTAGSSCFIPSTIRDVGSAIAVDATGAVYVGGSTNALDFPVTQGAYKTTCGCFYESSDVFLAKLNAAGTALVYSTYIPAPPGPNLSGDSLNALAIDPAGNIYATGVTGSTQFPTTAGALQSTFPENSTGVFALKLAAAGDRLLYSTFLADGPTSSVSGFQIDSSGNALLSGRTISAAPIATTGANISGDDYVARLNSDATALMYASRLPSGSADRGIALTAAGDIESLGSAGFLSRSIHVDSGFRSPAILGVANAAGLAISSFVAPGELISIYGTGVGPAQATGAKLDANGRLTTELAGVRVLINGSPIPLTFAGPDQINAVAPLNFNVGAPIQLEITRDGQSTASIGLWSRDTAAEVFRSSGPIPGTVLRFAAALNQDGSINSATNPAQRGSIVSVFVSGMGRMNAPQTDGDIPLAVLPKPVNSVTVDATELIYLGQAPGLVAGVVQVNFRLPSTPLSSTTFFNLQTADGHTSSFAIATKN